MPPRRPWGEIDVTNLPDHWITTPDQSRALNLAEMENNACMFTMYYAMGTYTDTGVPRNNGVITGLNNAAQDIDRRTWTPEAVSAVLGNATAESTINPSRWQNDTPPPDPETGTEDTGYGIVQWTPYSKYRDWVLGTSDEWDGYPDEMRGYNPEFFGTWQNNGYLQSERIAWERDKNLQWLSTSQYNMSFADFAASRDDPETLADAFMLCYERPADPNASRAERQAWARYWFERVVLPIYGDLPPGIWKWFMPYIFNKIYVIRGRGF